MIQGKATPIATAEYIKRMAHRGYNTMGDTGLVVSHAGFGGYRVSKADNEHCTALKKAVINGINVIDTSANYMNAASEQLIGSVIAELIDNHLIDREEIVLMTKGGIIQEDTLKEIKEKPEIIGQSGQIIQYEKDLAYCLTPDFLSYQIARSQQHLGVETIDVFLIKNPEIILNWYHRQKLSPARARKVFYDQIELVFRYFEDLVQKGVIQYYGISSNALTVSINHPAFISFDKLDAIAEKITTQHHFRVIQCPLNLLEPSAITSINQKQGNSVVSYAAQKGYGVFVNRPLNALLDNQLIRLSDLISAGYVSHQKVEDVMANLISQERRFLAQFEQVHQVLKDTNVNKDQTQNQDDSFEKVAKMWNIGSLLNNYWREFKGYEHWKETLQRYFVPKVEYSINYIFENKLMDSQINKDFYDYIKAINVAFSILTSFYKNQAVGVTDAIKQLVRAVNPHWGEVSNLSSIAIRACRSTRGITCVLVGMRKESYVDEVLEELAKNVEVKNYLSVWQTLEKKLGTLKQLQKTP